MIAKTRESCTSEINEIKRKNKNKNKIKIGITIKNNKAILYKSLIY